MFKGGIVRTLPGRFFRFLTEFNRGQFTLERYKRERKNLINSLIFLSSFSSLGNGSKSIHAVPKLRTREPGRHTTTERNWRWDHVRRSITILFLSLLKFHLFHVKSFSLLSRAMQHKKSYVNVKVGRKRNKIFGIYYEEEETISVRLINFWRKLKHWKLQRSRLSLSNKFLVHSISWVTEHSNSSLLVSNFFYVVSHSFVILFDDSEDIFMARFGHLRHRGSYQLIWDKSFTSFAS